MSVPLLLDQNIEHEVLHRLQKYGHEAEHINFHQTLQRGDPDTDLSRYSLKHQVLIVTYDDDFETEIPESDYWGVLLLSDDSWSAKQVADTVHQILDLYDASSLSCLNLVGREWL